MIYPSLQEHFDPTRQPKRILALDGGGVRGIVTLAFLREIEQLLRKRYGGDPHFRLCHYFDLIGGTSTGAIIASALACGMRVDEVESLYRALAARVFKRSWFRKGVVRAKFSRAALASALKDALGEDTRLRDPVLKTGLMVMAKRLDTSSPWVFHNNPSGKYFEAAPGEDWIANGDFLLWKVVRASTAAPHYFGPETLEVDSRGDTRARGRFIDGGVTTANNPSLQLLMLASLSGYGLNWPLGENKVLLVSVGTGLRSSDRSDVGLLGRGAAVHALNALVSVMDDCNALVETLLQWMSRGPTAQSIDAEIGDLGRDTLGDRPLLTYHRYNIHFEASWLAKNLELELSPKDLARLAKMDAPKNLPQLHELGAKAASKQVVAAHFSSAFDLVMAPPSASASAGPEADVPVRESSRS